VPVATEDPHRHQLKKMVGPLTTLLIGLGIAIGSGIFRTPALAAQQLGSPVWMIGAWVVGALFVFTSGLVSGELSTRFPQAGGEYVYLREAYGEKVAFLFGYAYTVFILGGGCGTIAAASGEALTELFAVDKSNAPILGVLAVAVITTINAFGLKAGAGLQNALTVLKITAILAVAAIAFFHGGSATDWSAPAMPPPNTTLAAAMLGAIIPVLWAYEGTTDPVKMAEEMKDVRRDLPRALIGAALSLLVLYVLVNVAFLSVLTPDQMAKSTFVASDVMEIVFGPIGRRLMSALSLIVFLGSLSASMLATVRVTFALARDGLTFPGLAYMSKGQAPVPALIVVGALAASFCAFRSFRDILNIYFLAAAILFGLSYASLIVFRRRDQKAGLPFPKYAFRCPAGPVLAAALVLFEIYLAASIVMGDVDRLNAKLAAPEMINATFGEKIGEVAKMDSLYTLLLIASIAALYFVWRRFFPKPKTA
jgi:basic amino acid/polyamine antiporter, APA family